MLDKLKAAGFNWLAFGIEAGADRVRANVDKSFDQEEVYDVIDKVRRRRHQRDRQLHLRPARRRPRDDAGDARHGPRSQLRVRQLLFGDGLSRFAALHHGRSPGSCRCPSKWTGYSQHSRDCLPLPTKSSDARRKCCNFRDEAFSTYYTRPAAISTWFAAVRPGDRRAHQGDDEAPAGARSGSAGKLDVPLATLPMEKEAAARREPAAIADGVPGPPPQDGVSGHRRTQHRKAEVAKQQPDSHPTWSHGGERLPTPRVARLAARQRADRPGPGAGSHGGAGVRQPSGDRHLRNTSEARPGNGPADRTAVGPCCRYRRSAGGMRCRGLDRAELAGDRAAWPTEHRAFHEDAERHGYPGGENLAQVRDRALPAIERLAARYAGQTFVVVSHGVVNRVLLAALDRHPAALRPANTAGQRGPHHNRVPDRPGIRAHPSTAWVP